jgi:hypothetical protein
MTKSVRLHPGIAEKYDAWWESLPGSASDKTMLLNASWEDFGRRAIAHAARNKLGSEPFRQEGPASQWFLVAVIRLSWRSRQVLILDLVEPPDARAAH